MSQQVSSTSLPLICSTPPARGAVLFSVGFVLSIILDSLQQETGVSMDAPDPASFASPPAPHQTTHHVNHNQHPQHAFRDASPFLTSNPFPLPLALSLVLADLDPFRIFHTASWLPFCFGFAGVLMGFLYPSLDLYLRARPPRLHREVSTILRLVGGVMGVNYATSKLAWVNGLQASLAVFVLSLGLWFMFDRTRHGFAASCAFAAVGTAVGCGLVSCGLYSFASPDFLGIKSWFPFILFLSSVCFGSIGRGLAGADPHYRRQLSLATSSAAASVLREGKGKLRSGVGSLCSGK
ncbi:insulin-induced protein-domain-containing protein [Chytriomyces sp. MP71]|nr:insulin-induced protein-domain-containing protein [Chytriomyces sp. MP71]